LYCILWRPAAGHRLPGTLGTESMGGGASKWLSCSSAQPETADARVVGSTDPINNGPNGNRSIHERRPSAIDVTNGSGDRSTNNGVCAPAGERAAELLVTPRREKALYAGVVDTPKGKAVLQYKYFCPICTLYFEDILRSQCCGNYSCMDCTIQYVDKRGQKVSSPAMHVCSACTFYINTIKLTLFINIPIIYR
jgi:hypothetical protein